MAYESEGSIGSLAVLQAAAIATATAFWPIALIDYSEKPILKNLLFEPPRRQDAKVYAKSLPVYEHL